MYTVNAQVVKIAEELASVAESFVSQDEVKALRNHAFAIIAAWYPVQSDDRRVMRLRSKFLGEAESILKSL